MNKLIAQQLVKWLMENTQKLEYGKVNLNIIIHAGEIRRIEQTTSQSTIPSKENGTETQLGLTHGGGTRFRSLQAVPNKKR